MCCDVTAIGEVLIDLVQVRTSDCGIGEYAANPGGAPANVAVAVSRLGGSAAFIGCTGRDTFGETLRQTLAHDGVDISGMSRADGVQTTLAVVSVDAAGERSFAFYRNPGADQMLTRQAVPEKLIENTLFLHFGSVSLTADPARSATMYAVERARALGKLVSYDPNYRAALWQNAAEAEKRMREPLPLVDVLKISDEETGMVTGETDVEKAAEKMRQTGIRLVLITLGADGVYYRCGDLCGSVAGFRVKVADTNGAGDTFFGAVLSALAKRGGIDGLTKTELEEILTFANKAAALTTSRPGAIPAMPTLEEVSTRSLPQR